MVCFTYLKVFLEIGLAGHTTDIPVWKNSSWYHTAYSHKACYMAEFSRTACVDGESSHLPHARCQEGWSCSSTCPAEMGSCERLNLFAVSWPDPAAEMLTLLSWFAHWLLLFTSPCWTVQLEIYHRPNAWALEQWCSGAHGCCSPLCFLLP